MVARRASVWLLDEPHAGLDASGRDTVDGRSPLPTPTPAPRTRVVHGGHVAFVPMAEIDRALVTGRTEGFLKLIVGPRRLTPNLAGGRILGATVVAPRAGEILHEIALAMRAGLFPARVALTVHAYPTWSTAVRQAAAQLFMDVNGRHAEPARTDGHLATP